MRKWSMSAIMHQGCNNKCIAKRFVAQDSLGLFTRVLLKGVVQLICQMIDAQRVDEPIMPPSGEKPSH